MTTDGGGNPRFKGKGMQWKTGWGSKKPFDMQMPFFEGFLTNNIVDPAVNRYYLGLAGEGLPGSVTGFWVGGVIFVRSGIAAETMASYGDGTVPTQGWSLNVIGSKVRFSVGDGAALTFVEATVETSDPDAVTSAEVQPVLAVLDPNNTEIKLYVGAVTGLATTTFAVPYVTPITGRTSLGGFYTGSGGGAAHLGINGLVGGNFIPTALEIAAWFDAVKSAFKTSQIPAKTDALWAANDYISANAPSTPAPHVITDEIAATNLFVIGNRNGIVINQYGALFEY